jgi:CO/xanthine dehydrogenase FAD-binding subunit
MPLTVKTFDQLRDAASAMGSDPTTHFLGGGTLLVRRVNEGDLSIATLVRTTDRRFSEIRPSGGRVFIGAGVTMAQIITHPDLRFLRPVAAAIGGPAIRNMATVGGNLFAPHPFGDFAMALLVLEASVSVLGGYSARDVPLEDFLGNRDQYRRSIIAGVTVRRPEGERSFRFVKISRTRPKGPAVLSIAAYLPLSGGRLSSPRVAYGAMAPQAVRARAVEAALNGRALDKASIAPAIAAAGEGTTPLTDAYASAWYRSQVLPIHLERLLLS